MKPQITLLATALLLGASSFGLPAMALGGRSLTTANANPAGSMLLAQSNTPERTYMTPQRNPNEIAVDISDGEFRVYGIMHRSYGNFFTLTTRGVQVSYNRDTGNVLVVNSVTGTEFYNYFFTEASQPSTSTGSHSTTPESTTLTPIGNGQISAYITDGEFSFSGALSHSTGNTYIGQDNQVRVIYDRGTSRITVINKVTGDEFYNYIYSTANEGAL